MLNKKGFSLLSFLIYLMLFTMVTFFSCHIIVSLIIPSLTSLRKCHSIVALHIASDLFVRDIHAIKNEKNMWKVIHPFELVWQSTDHDIGWRFNDNCLERIEGIYNQGWKKKTTSIVACGISNATFIIEKHQDHIMGIELALIPIYTAEKPIKCYVTLRQGKLYE